jgi:hypothetical protein
VLVQVTHEAHAAGSSGAGTGGLWEAQAVLLLWLSILVLTPFDLAILDSAVTADAAAAAAAHSGAAGSPGCTPLAARLMTLCQGFLSQPGERWRPLQRA